MAQSVHTSIIRLGEVHCTQIYRYDTFNRKELAKKKCLLSTYMSSGSKRVRKSEVIPLHAAKIRRNRTELHIRNIAYINYRVGPP